MQHRGHTISATESETWGGTVRLDRDFVVAADGTLTILPGTQILAKAEDDRAPIPGGSALVEILIQGTLNAEGAPGSEITFGTYDGTSEDGEWYGIRFDVGGLANAGYSYGYFGCDYPISKLKHVTLDDVEVGVQIENHCAPEIDNLVITNPGTITGSSPAATAGIVLHETDVVIPVGFWEDPGTYEVFNDNNDIPAYWDLDGPFNVVASNDIDPANDLGAGVSNRVDLIAEGRLITTGSTSGYVVFRPMTENNDTCDDWGGVSLDSYARSDVDFADISHAANPVYLYYPDSLATVSNSKIHHFADVAIWVKGSSEAGGVIEYNAIERGSGVDLLLGNEAILLDAAPHTHVANNTISLKDDLGLLAEGDWGGIRAFFGKNFCLGAPSGATDTLRIVDNTISGDPLASGSRAGIFFDWICGSPDREIDIMRNLIHDWNFAGIRFSQNSNVQVTCNRIQDNWRAVDFQRNTEPVGNGVRFKDNRMEIGSSDYALVVTDDAIMTKMGPNTFMKGTNRLRTAGARPVLFEDDSDTDVLVARDNYWYKDNNLQTTDPTVSALIGTNLPSGPHVDYSGFFVNEPMPEDPPCLPGPPTRAAPPSLAQAVVEDNRPKEERDGLPLATSLGRPRPNPAEILVEIPFAVGQDEAGVHELAVYDVSGRRVRTVVDSELASGVYQGVWDRRDSAGRHVTSGVYFVRLVGPRFHAVQKLVVLE